MADQEDGGKGVHGTTMTAKVWQENSGNIQVDTNLSPGTPNQPGFPNDVSMGVPNLPKTGR